MGYPKGSPRGPQKPEHIAKLAVIRSQRQRERWGRPDSRAKLLASLQKSWDTGALSKRKAVWTPDKDARLQTNLLSLGWRSVRTGARRMFNCDDHSVVTRIRALGLSSRHVPIWIPGLYGGDAQDRGVVPDMDYESMMRVIQQAIPRQLPREIRDDVTQDLLVALMEGRLDPDQISSAVKRYISGNYSMYQDGKRTFSLDESKGEDGKLSAYDRRDFAAQSGMEW